MVPMVFLCCLSLVQALRLSSPRLNDIIPSSQVSALESLGFVSTFSATATPVISQTTTVVDIQDVTPTPTLFVDPAALATFTTTLGVATTMTTTLFEVGPTVTPLPPAPVVSLCSPYFYQNNTLYYLKDGSQLEKIPYLTGMSCQIANITSIDLAKGVAKELCENVFIEDGLVHHSGFVPYQCPILSPDAVIKSPKGGCNGTATFDTLCQIIL